MNDIVRIEMKNELTVDEFKPADKAIFRKDINQYGLVTAIYNQGFLAGETAGFTRAKERLNETQIPCSTSQRDSRTGCFSVRSSRKKVRRS
jgi:hypothetical protein